MNPETFEIKSEHLKLLGRYYWQWNPACFGGPTVDPKRPFGNSSVLFDVAEILEMQWGEDEDLPEHLEAQIYHLCEQMVKVLQIISDTLTIPQPGSKYVKSCPYSGKWSLTQ